ncbi:MAG TPA: hypothetical protein VEQ10_19580 [Vicinamibacteria bacterium]|nr:hypothetical protein [Vicinamibacteria bacterium]
MSVLNAALRPAFDLLLLPFAAMPAMVGLVLVSLVVSVLMLVVFKRTSNQPALALVKRKIHAGIFEIRLFNDDLRAILRAQNEILRHNLTYLRLSLWPMLFLLPPLVLVIAQLQFHYGYRGLRPGERALLEVDLDRQAAAAARPQVALELPAGLRAETDAVWLPTQSQLVWRLVAERDGDYELGLAVAGAQHLSKTVRVTPRTVRLSPERVAAGFFSQLLYPAEPPLPAGPVRSIRLSYPEREIVVLGHGMNWMIPFFGLSILFAFALRSLFKVTI